jgi:peptide deformylase
VIRPVLQLPDHVLGTPCAPVGELAARARAVAQDLLDTMRGAAHSVGVAAPQIGISLRVCVVDVTGHKKARSQHGEVVLIDPVVVEAGGPEIGREGCMSVPDLTGDVARFTAMHVRALGLDGELHDYEVDAFEARAFQHELDHLDGLLFLDRVVADDRVFRRRVYR